MQPPQLEASAYAINFEKRTRFYAWLGLLVLNLVFVLTDIYCQSFGWLFFAAGWGFGFSAAGVWRNRKFTRVIHPMVTRISEES